MKKVVGNQKHIKIFSKLLNSETVYCDIGAWIGPTVIYAAKTCKEVICFEPDPVAYKYLLCNIALNEFKNVTSFSFALSSQVGIQKMSARSDNLGESMTTLVEVATLYPKVNVLTLTWEMFKDYDIFEKINFIKMDIEGGEFALLPTMEKYLSLNKPTLYLSLHPTLLSKNVRKEEMIKNRACIKNLCKLF